MNQIVTQDGGALAERPGNAAPDVGQLLTLAIKSGMAPEQLEKLVSLQERMLDRQAAADFGAAMAGFQSEMTPLTKSRSVTVTGRDGSKFSYSYAELNHIAELVKPLLKKYGLSYRFNSHSSGGEISITCIVQHIAGHKESTLFTAPIDKGLRMNEPQKWASTTSYARRYALMLALGLTVAGDDDDGRGAQTVPITAEQAKYLRGLLASSGRDEAKLLTYIFGVTLSGQRKIEDIPQSAYERAVTALGGHQGGAS